MTADRTSTAQPWRGSCLGIGSSSLFPLWEGRLEPRLRPGLFFRCYPVTLGQRHGGNSVVGEGERGVVLGSLSSPLRDSDHWHGCTPCATRSYRLTDSGTFGGSLCPSGGG
jgi:hypothetical protein